ncbi:MAG TPA: HD domain-containing phosphohydrolase [Rhizobacter sp.]|nr:HD domain-containing phosphohydrolase [Rhizobacter sp.]
MKEIPPSTLIDVQLLRIGMFVHLDGGWMSHPFPLSSFKIGTAEQIRTIRSLGKERIRWSPEKSDPEPADLPAPGSAAASAAAPEQVAAAKLAAAEVLKAAEKAAAEAAETPEMTERRKHREALAAQRAALSMCEQQFAEAARACKRSAELVSTQPQEARQQSEALAQAFVSKMLGQQEICIRLLTEGAGDKASLHAINVAVISMLMGKTFGLSESEMADLGVGALLHDIGKIELPDRLRHREDHFTSAELLGYQEHVAHGVTLARKMGLKPGASLVIAQHHEHADSSGFPLKLNADRMSTASRIVSLVNRYDNLCNPHVPSRALTPHEALSLLFAQGKSKFETSILGGFIRMMGVYPPGSAVQLTDDRYAMVMSVNSARPLKPRVLVHDGKVAREDALLVDLEAEPRLGIRRSLKPQQLPPEALNFLSPRTRIAYFFEADSQPLELAA